jgi:hypothetical protein
MTVISEGSDLPDPRPKFDVSFEEQRVVIKCGRPVAMSLLLALNKSCNREYPIDTFHDMLRTLFQESRTPRSLGV